jgi:hypothetical protein
MPQKAAVPPDPDQLVQLPRLLRLVSVLLVAISLARLAAEIARYLDDPRDGSVVRLQHVIASTMTSVGLLTPIAVTAFKPLSLRAFRVVQWVLICIALCGLGWDVILVPSW